MNKNETKKWIKNNLFDKLGKLCSIRLKSSWFFKHNFENYYYEIMRDTWFLTDSTLSEHLFCYMNDIDTPVLCLLEKCNNKVTFENFRYGHKQYCSCKCANQDDRIKEKRKQTCIQKYGFENVYQVKKIKDKIKQTCLNKFGVEHASQSKETKDKIKQTNMKKYGTECVFQSKKIRQKIKNTNIKKYGVENVYQSEEIKDRIKQICLERYGVKYSFQSKEMKEKSKQACIQKYGFEHASQNKKIKNKIKQTCIQKYGFDHPSQQQKLYYEDATIKILNDKEILKKYHYSDNKNLRQISKEIGVAPSTLQKYYKKHGIEIKNYFISQYEKEITEYIDLDNIQTNTRNIISPYELDIYLPDHKLAIEFDGLYWHSDKPKNYHLNKTKLCEEQGIQLFHIFENEWLDLNKQDIWKSLISNKLCRNKRIHGRKCEIKETMDNKQIKEFINNNHLQGYCPSSIKLGLFYKDELVSLMTFGKTRFSKKYEWEMIRFCNKKFISVIGGASKLYKYFVKNYNPESIISYADRRYSTGNLYDKLGFEFSHFSNPNYFYFRNELKLHSRVKFQKHKLRDLLENFDSNKSEVENMISNDYHRIFDCGNYIYVKNIKEKINDLCQF